MGEKVDFSFEVEEELWAKFKELCKREGVEPDAVIEAYLRAVIECRGIPFSHEEDKCLKCEKRRMTMIQTTMLDRQEKPKDSIDSVHIRRISIEHQKINKGEK